jgi:pre-rRNA-processing protein IPI1
LPQQAIVRDKESDEAFEHFLSLTKHHNSDTRKEALVQIQTHVHQHLGNLRPVFQATAPLILDESKKVRDMVEQLYGSVELKQHLHAHGALVMLYVHSAMTNIGPEVRGQSTNFLTLLLDSAPREVARLAWTRTISNFFPLLGWPIDVSSSKSEKLASATVTTGLSFGTSASKYKLAHITALKSLLTTCLDDELDGDETIQASQYHPDTLKFLLPTTNSSFAA